MERDCGEKKVGFCGTVTLNHCKQGLLHKTQTASLGAHNLPCNPQVTFIENDTPDKRHITTSQ